MPPLFRLPFRRRHSREKLMYSARKSRTFPQIRRQSRRLDRSLTHLARILMRPARKSTKLTRTSTSFTRKSTSFTREMKNFTRESRYFTRESRYFTRESRYFTRETENFARELRNFTRGSGGFAREIDGEVDGVNPMDGSLEPFRRPLRGLLFLVGSSPQVPQSSTWGYMLSLLRSLRVKMSGLDVRSVHKPARK